MSEEQTYDNLVKFTIFCLKKLLVLMNAGI